MEKVILVTEPSPQEKELFGAKSKTNSLKAMYADRQHLTTSFIIGSKISKGKIYCISELITCRERMTQFINGCVKAPKILEKYWNNDTCSYEFNVPNQQYTASKQMARRSNLMIVGRFPYPSRKLIREETEAKKAAATARAEAALRVLNDLEEMAGWRKTELFSIELDNPDLFKRKNFLGFCFSGPKDWFDSPYVASIFALICRTVKHKVERVEDIAGFDSYIKSYKEQNKVLQGHWGTRVDADFIRITSYSWAPLVKNFKAVIGSKGRLASYKASMDEDKAHPWQQGIKVLCDGTAGDKGACRRLKEITGAARSAW